jgi:multiple sugar transport system substrate-binding protein
VDAVGALHGTYPTLAEEDAMMNMIDIAEDLMADRDFAPAFLETGLLGTDDYLYYVPWMQATYIMAASTEALDYLPDGADVNALTWEEFGGWCQNILDETGEPKCGLPHAGLFHRFLEGYMWPSFTGGMVTTFASDEAVSMMEWARDVLWPTINPQSINQLRVHARAAALRRGLGGFRPHRSFARSLQYRPRGLCSLPRSRWTCRTRLHAGDRRVGYPEGCS